MDPQTPEHVAMLEAMAQGIACPRCGHVGAELTWTHVPAGETYVNGTYVASGPAYLPNLRCPGCGITNQGQYEQGRVPTQRDGS